MSGRGYIKSKNPFYSFDIPSSFYRKSYVIMDDNYKVENQTSLLTTRDFYLHNESSPEYNYERKMQPFLSGFKRGGFL